VGESTHGLRVGVRESALVVLPQDFQIAVNTQPICEKSETLGVYVVKDLEDAAVKCKNTDGCLRFAFFSVAARPEFATNTAFLCSGASLLALK
ncbi:unnamed protein product, partial [Durusdinium trenchii]